MTKSALFDVLKGLEMSEWNLFRAYLLSKYKEDTEMLIIYDYIAKYRKNLDHKKLNIQYANDFLFKKKSIKNFQNIMSRIRADLMDFMAIQNVINDPKELNLHKIEALNRRGLYDEAIKQNEIFQNETTEQDIDLWNSWYKYRAWHEIKYSDNPYKGNVGEQVLWKKLRSLLGEFKANLNVYHRVDALHLKKLVNADLEKIEIDKSKSGDRAFELLVLLNEFQTHETVASFKALKKVLINSSKAMQPNIGSYILLLLMHYVIRNLKRGVAMWTDLKELYDFGLDTELMLDNGKMTERRYLTYFNLKGVLGENLEKDLLDAEELINKVKASNREELVNLAKCHLYLGYDQPNEVLDIIKYLDSKSTKDSKNVIRVLELICFMELYPNDNEFLMDKIRNVVEYQRRISENISPVQSKGLLNFCHFAKMLLKNKPLEEIKEYVYSDRPILMRSWIYKRLER